MCVPTAHHPKKLFYSGIRIASNDPPCYIFVELKYLLSVYKCIMSINTHSPALCAGKAPDEKLKTNKCGNGSCTWSQNKWKTLKYRNRSTETEVWKQKYGGEKKSYLLVFKCLTDS